MYSIIVPTFNRAESLARTVQSLQAQRADVPYEILVVDNNSTDRTASLVRSLAVRSGGRVRHVFESSQGLSLARNRGIAEARGEVLVFVDDDVVARPGWLGALAETYRRHPDAWCVGGKIVLALPDTWPGWFDPGSPILGAYLSALNYGDGEIELEYPQTPHGANMSLRREAVERVGQFDPRVGPIGLRHAVGDDSDLCWRVQRAGGRVYYCGQATVEHVVPPQRLTKRWFRARAFGGGEAFAQLGVLPASRAWRELGHWALVGLRHTVSALVAPGRADRRRMFEDELVLWWSLGAVRQHVSSSTLRLVPSRPGGNEDAARCASSS